MLIRIRHSENRELLPDNLVFHFEDPGLGRRFGDLAKKVVGKKDAGEPEIVIPVARGDHVFAGLSSDRGERFCLNFPESVRSEVNLVLSPLGSLGRNKKVPLKISSLIRDNTLHISYRALRLGKIPILYISPESLINRNLRNDLHTIINNAPVNCLLIDKVHCISEWGPEFRPAYLNIPRIMEDLNIRNPELTVIAVTAVSGEMIRRDVLHFLKLKDISPPASGMDYYREKVSFQIITAEGSEGKRQAARELVQRDIPRLLRDNGISGFSPAAFPVYSDPYSPFQGISHPADTDTQGFTDIAVSTDIKIEKTHISLRAGMGDSPETWLYSIAGEGRSGNRLHAVRLADLPLSACEKNMSYRQSRVPSCSEKICPYGKKELCDYGKQHHLISRMYPDTIAEVMTALDILDRLLCSHAKGENPVRIPLSSVQQKKTEKAMYRFSLIRLTDRFAIDFRDREPVFKVYGFSGFLTEDAALAGILGYLRRNDISVNRKFDACSLEDIKGISGEVERYDEICGSAIFEAMEESGRGKWEYYGEQTQLFQDVGRYLLPVICHIQDELRAMAYRRLGNLKDFFRNPACRYSLLLKNVQATDEEWKCGRCDRCVPDMRFDLSDVKAPPAVYGLEELEKQFAQWLEDDSIPFDAVTADSLIHDYGDFYDNLRIRACKVLEYHPRNIKALYLVRELCKEEEKAMHTAELMRVVSADMKPLQTIRFYETSRADQALKQSLFHLLDDEYGSLNSEDGEKWLYSEALRLSMPPRITEMLKGRVMLNILAKTGFRSRNTRLRHLLKEF